MKQKSVFLDANQVLASVLGNKGNKQIFQWIADTAIFCPIEKLLNSDKSRTENFFLKVNNHLIRRSHPGTKEKRGQIVNGVYLDDNSVINYKFKALVNQTHCKNYETCHIWQDYAYCENVFCAVPNIVLLPRVLAKFSDYYPPVIDLLTYRSYELYNWYPDDAQPPQKPINYPKRWLTPIDFVKSVKTNKRKSVSELLDIWSKKPNSIVYQTIKILKNCEDNKLSFNIFAVALKDISSSPEITISSLCTDAGHSYGKVFKNENGIISILEEYKEKINDLWK